jgi:hypothetical protein
MASQRNVRFSNKYANRQNNNFREQVPIIKQFKVIDQEFPDLCPSEKRSSREQHNPKVEYKKAIMIEKKLEQIVNRVDPGCVKLEFDKHTSGNVIWTFSKNEPLDDSSEEIFEIAANRAINKIIRNWYNYRENYNIEYGEGAYEKLYGYESPDESEDDDSESDSDCYYSETNE